MVFDYYGDVFGVVLNSIAFATYLYFGSFILLLDRKKKANVFFFIVCILYAVWSFCFIFINSPLVPDAEKLIWLKIGYTAALSYSPFAFLFVFSYAGFFQKIKYKALFCIGVFIVPGVFLFMHVFFDAFINDIPRGFWYISSHVYANVYNLSSIVVVIIGAIFSGSRRMKRQVIIIASGAFIAIVSTLITDFYSAYKGVPTLTPALLSIWIGSVWFALVRYRLFAVNERLINEIVSSNIDEVIIFLDLHNKIRTVNKKMMRLTRRKSDEILNDSVFDYFNNDAKLKKSLFILKQNKKEQFSLKLNLKTRQNEGVLLNTRLQLVKDKYRDVLGILLIGKEVRGFERLKVVYGLSPREIEVVQCVMTGNTNSEIALQLYISLRTVKAHLTNIYNKIGIDNKVQMLNAVLEENE